MAAQGRACTHMLAIAGREHLQRERDAALEALREERTLREALEVKHAELKAELHHRHMELAEPGERVASHARAPGTGGQRGAEARQAPAEREAAAEVVPASSAVGVIETELAPLPDVISGFPPPAVAGEVEPDPAQQLLVPFPPTETLPTDQDHIISGLEEEVCCLRALLGATMEEHARKAASLERELSAAHEQV